MAALVSVVLGLTLVVGVVGVFVFGWFEEREAKQRAGDDIREEMPLAERKSRLREQRRAFAEFFSAHGKSLRGKYTLPEGDNLSYWGTDANTYFYKAYGTGEPKAPYWTTGDFNKDGVIDRVYILFASNDAAARVFAFVSRADGYEVVDVGPATKQMAVDACVTKKDGLRLLQAYELEGHGWAYVWDPALMKFRQLQGDEQHGECQPLSVADRGEGWAEAR